MGGSCTRGGQPAAGGTPRWHLLGLPVPWMLRKGLHRPGSVTQRRSEKETRRATRAGEPLLCAGPLGRAQRLPLPSWPSLGRELLAACYSPSTPMHRAWVEEGGKPNPAASAPLEAAKNMHQPSACLKRRTLGAPHLARAVG